MDVPSLLGVRNGSYFDISSIQMSVVRVLRSMNSVSPFLENTNSPGCVMLSISLAVSESKGNELWTRQ